MKLGLCDGPQAVTEVWVLVGSVQGLLKVCELSCGKGTGREEQNLSARGRACVGGCLCVLSKKKLPCGDVDKNNVFQFLQSPKFSKFSDVFLSFRIFLVRLEDRGYRK